MKKLIGATFLMILLACGNGRNEMPTPMVEFILLPDLNPRVPPEDYTLLLSDDEGNVLYYEKATRFRYTIKVALASQKNLHLTYGLIDQDGFSIKTIKNIVSGFSFSNVFFGECQRIGAGEVELVIKDIEFPKKLYTGLGFARYTYDTPNKELKIKGFIIEEGETLVTVLTSQNATYQSYLIPFSEWTGESSSISLSKEVSLSAFSDASIMEVELDKEGIWDVRSEVIWDNDTKIMNSMEAIFAPISLTTPSVTINNFQEGTKVNVFTKPDLLNPQYNVEFFGQGHYERIVGALPEKLTLYDPFIEIIDPSTTNFQANLSDDVDFSNTTFQFTTENTISMWSVEQLNTAEKDIEMITFPDEFLRNEPVLNGVIDKPRATIFSAYKTNLENIADIFQKREISEQLRCLSHSRKTVN